MIVKNVKNVKKEKKKMTSHNMIFDATPDLVWVTLVGRDRTFPQLQKKHIDFVCEFQEWLYKQDFYPFKTSTTGGGQWHGAFYAEDWPKVKVWLKEHGAVAERYKPLR